MTNSVITTIYFDMDGVLSDFDQYMENILGCSINNTEEQLVKKVLENNITNDFFANLDPMHDFSLAKQLMNKLNTMNFNIFILTATGETEYKQLVQQHKKQWIEKYGLDCYGFIFVQKSWEKSYYADKNSLLIDDRNKSIVPFINQGGWGIKHKTMRQTIEQMNKNYNFDLSF